MKNCFTLPPLIFSILMMLSNCSGYSDDDHLNDEAAVEKELKELFSLGEQEFESNNITSAYNYFAKSLQIARNTQNLEMEIDALFSIGSTLINQKQLDEFQELYEEHPDISDKLKSVEADAYLKLGQLYQQKGQLNLARIFYNKSIKSIKEMMEYIKKNDDGINYASLEKNYYYFRNKALINLEIAAENYEAAKEIYPNYAVYASTNELLEVLIKLNYLEHKKNKNLHVHNTLNELNDLFFKNNYQRLTFENFLDLAASELKYSDRTGSNYKREISYIHNNEAKRLYLRYYLEEERIFQDVLNLFYKEDNTIEDKIHFASNVRFFGERLARVIDKLINFETIYGEQEKANQYYADLSKIYSQIKDVFIIMERQLPAKAE